MEPSVPGGTDRMSLLCVAATDRWTARGGSLRLTAVAPRTVPTRGSQSGSDGNPRRSAGQRARPEAVNRQRRSARAGQPSSERGPSSRPVLVRHRVLDGVPPASVEPHPMLAQHTLADSAEALYGGLRTSVVDVGVPYDADCPESVEGVTEHEQLRLRVVPGAPPPLAEPGMSDGESPARRIHLVVRRCAREVTSAYVDLGVREPLATGPGGERGQNVPLGVLERDRFGQATARRVQPAEHFGRVGASSGGAQVARGMVQLEWLESDQPTIEVGKRVPEIGHDLDPGKGSGQRILATVRSAKAPRLKVCD